METSEKNEKVKKDSNIFTKETFGMLMVLFATLCFVCLVTGGLIFSSIGAWVKYFLLGIFGYSAYVQCLLCIYFGVTMVIGKSINISKKASTVLSLIFVLLVFLLHAITSASFTTLNFGKYLGNCYTVAKGGLKTATGGGLVAGLLVYWGISLFTPVGFYIIIAVAIVLLGAYIYKSGAFKFEKKQKSVANQEEQVENTVSESESADEVEQAFANMLTGNDAVSVKKNPLFIAPGAEFEQLSKREKEESLSLNTSEKGLNISSVKREEAPPTPKTDLASSIEYIKKPQPLDVEKALKGFDNNGGTSVSKPIKKVEEPVKKIEEQINFTDYSDSVVSTGSDLDDYFNSYERKKEKDNAGKENKTPFANLGSTIYEQPKDEPYAPESVDDLSTEEFLSSIQADDYKNNEDLTDTVSQATVEENFGYGDFTDPAINEIVEDDYTEEAVDEVESVVAEDFAVETEEILDTTVSDQDDLCAVDGDFTNDGVEQTETVEETLKIEEPIEVDEPAPVIEDFSALKQAKENAVKDAIADEYAKEQDSAPDLGVNEPIVEEKPARSRVEDYAKTIAPKPTPTYTAPTPAYKTPVPVYKAPTPAVPEKVETVKPEKPKVVEPINRPYHTPPLSYFVEHAQNVTAEKNDHEGRIAKIEETLQAFKVDVKGVNYIEGPSLTRYEFSFPINYPIKNVIQHEANLNASLEVVDGVRVLAPIPGKNLIGIEVANKTRIPVSLKSGLKEVMNMSSEDSSLLFPIGKDVVGKTVHYDIAKGKHFLVAGSTGSGKSIFLNSLILSLITRYSPEDVKLILIDPKTVEFMVYNHLPHLMVDEIISDHVKVLAVLDWAYQEMERRYRVFRDCGGRVVNIEGYNRLIASDTVQKMPRIVIIIDEVADLMNICKKDLERKVAALTAKARASGIHLILATQRPSVDVITGVIKANLPTRVAFKTISSKDSETILGTGGAEKLLGKGDMLFKIDTAPVPERYQGAFVNETETADVVEYVIKKNKAYYNDELAEYLENAVNPPVPEKSFEGEVGGAGGDPDGDLLPKALAFIIDSNVASISALQTEFEVGFSRAKRLINKMEKMGYISPANGQKPRNVLISKEQFIQIYGDVEN